MSYLQGGAMNFLSTLGLVAVVLSQDPEFKSASSPHYELKHTVSEKRAKEILDYLERFHDAALEFLQPDNPEEVGKKKCTIVLYGDATDYNATNPLGHAAGYYLASRIVSHDGEQAQTLSVLAHEVVHHLTDITSVKFHSVPSWFIEGVAEALANSEVRDGKTWFCIPTGSILMGRLPKVKQNMELGRWYPLKADENTMQDLRTLPRTEFYDDSSLAYAEAWALCHFLLTSGQEGTHPIPRGRYAKNFMAYYKEVRSGTPGAEAWTKAFPDVDLERLEGEWKEFVQKLDAGNALGVWGDEVSEEVHAKLKLSLVDSAIRLTRVISGWPGDKAGLKEGDILIRYDGTPLSKGGALSRLRDLADQTIGSREIVVRFRRDDKELERTVPRE
jgi:hypothetical protein